MADIPFSEEEWDKFYDEFGSRFFQLESATLHAHGEDQKKLLYEIFGSSKTLVQTIGVIAGFGFTAFGYIKNLYLFIGGEFFLFVAIFAGLFWTQTAYKSNLASSNAEVVRVKKLFATRYIVFKKIYDKAMSDIESGKKISIPESQMMDLQKQGNDLMEHFTSQAEQQNLSDPFGWLMLFFAIGGFFLLLSFVRLYVLF
jgi:hypothetical protein